MRDLSHEMRNRASGLIWTVLVSRVEETLMGMHFDNIDLIKGNMTTALKVISQNYFRRYIEG